MKKIALALITLSTLLSCKKEHIETTKPIVTRKELKFNGYAQNTTVRVKINGVQDEVNSSHYPVFFVEKGDVISVRYSNKTDLDSNNLKIVLDGKYIKIYNCICKTVFDTVLVD